MNSILNLMGYTNKTELKYHNRDTSASIIYDAYYFGGGIAEGKL